MTRGTVVVLGGPGRNLGAGMTGGEAFLLDPDESLVNGDLVTLVELERGDAERLLALIERHRDLTGSARAAALLADPEAGVRRFRRLVPRALADERDEVVEERATA
jgi:glutamate synthase (NADPH/NADH) large chain